MTEQLPQPTPAEQKKISEFSDVLQRTIADSPIPFSKYMDLALNMPGYGYYRRDISPISSDPLVGDFTTASELTDLYGAAIANDFAVVLRQCARPVILELGAGSGAFAYACLQQLYKLGSLPEQYLILETSAARASEQKQKLMPLAKEFKIEINWLQSLPEQPLNGVIVANEILDVLPVEVFKVTKSGFEMLYVACDTGLKDEWRQSSPELNSALASLQHKLGHKLPVGMQSEICLYLKSWLQSVASTLKQGLLFFADYGYTREVYYHQQRSSGTLHCHFKQHMHLDPYLYPGQQDITAHVDFSEVGDLLTDYGCECLGLLTQAEYLLQAGILELLERLDESVYISEAQKVKKLLHPNYMGEVFKVMAFVKGVDVEVAGFL